MVMLQVPPPSTQRCLSASIAQENELVMISPLSFSDGMVVDGGMQVAAVKKSTNLKTKNRGKIPPKLETLRKTLER